MNYPEEVKGAVHILIPNDEAKYPELVRRKIEAASILINMAAKILAEAEHADLMATTEKMLVSFTEKLIGKDGARAMYQKIIDRESTFIDGKSVEKAILFFDIKGFASITEAFQKAGLDKSFANLMNQFHTVAGSIITGHEGSINKFIGDAVLAVFPSNGPQIVKAAIQLQNVLPALNRHIAETFSGEINVIRESQPHFDPTLTLRIGLNSGAVTEGTIGASNEFYNMTSVLPEAVQSVERYEHGVLGRPVNEASRLESLGSYLGYFGIIMGESTHKHLDADDYVLRELYPVKLIGSKYPQLLYVVAGHADQVSEETKEIVDLHNRGIDALRRSELSAAKAFFNLVVERSHDDALAAFYLKKIKAIEETLFLNQSLMRHLDEGRYPDAYISILEGLSKDADGNNHFVRAVSDFVARPLNETQESRVDTEKFEHLRRHLPPLIESVRNKKKIDTLSILQQLSECGDCKSLANHFTGIAEGGDVLILDIGRFFYPSKK